MARSDPPGPFIKLSSPETEEFWKVPILFEDEALFAVEKPAGLLTSPDRYDPNRPNLIKLLHRDIERGAPWVRERNISYLANAHRLDFQTSGVLLLAKTKPALVSLANEFGSEKPAKTYLALVHGTPPEDEFSTEAKIAPHPFQAGLMRIDPKRGKRSRTTFQIIEKFSGYTFLRCVPLTGRTHQIRIHLRHLGFAIVGDERYGGEKLMLSSLKRGYSLKKNEAELPLMGRVGLHAESLRITHPASGELIRIEAPMPKDFSVALKYLKKFAGV